MGNDERRTSDERRANERQVGGDHYKIMPIEHWDLSVMFNMDPFQYQITKYVLRWRDKNGLMDLEKVVHFAQKYLEIERMRKEGNLTIELLRGAMVKLLREVNEEFDSQAEHATSLRDGTEAPHLVPVPGRDQ
jgi:hypothetical protein